MGVAERNAQLTADMAAAQERALQLQERAEAVEQALEERDATAEAEQLLLHRVRLIHGPRRQPMLTEKWHLQRLRHCSAILEPGLV